MPNGKPLRASGNEDKVRDSGTEPEDVGPTTRKPPRSAPAGNIAMPVKQPVLKFANEKAQIAWEIGQKLPSILKDIPAENQTLDAKTITFAPENLSRGTYAIFLSGTVIGTDKSDVFVVPERSLQILERLEIHYQVV